jgi:hypothetical protein
MPAELAPCPFCGSEAKITKTMYQVTCNNWSSCAVKPRVTSNDELVAIAKWNERIGTPNPLTGNIISEVEDIV